MSKHSLSSVLGNMSADQFLTEYWQQKPLLIRNAIEDFNPPIDADELAGLSLEDEVESRLIIGDNWRVEHGPFGEDLFHTLGEQGWTLLVQAVNLWVPDVAKLLEKFDFLPSWRIDDVMVSFAADGGGVGPHFDNYDVFLLQGSGSRRWQVGGVCDNESPLIDHESLRILANPQFNEEWILNTGDMLYLPPRVSHQGIAMGPCTTFSIGFRAPSAADILDDLTAELNSQNKLSDYLKDPVLNTEIVNGSIPKTYVDQIRQLIEESLSDDDALLHWFAQYMTRPKYPQLTDITGESRGASIEVDAAKSTVCYRNGERE